MQVHFPTELAEPDTVDGDHMAREDLVQSDAWKARANDLITHLQPGRKQTLSRTLVTNNELWGTELQTPRFTFITRSSAEVY